MIINDLDRDGASTEVIAENVILANQTSRWIRQALGRGRALVKDGGYWQRSSEDESCLTFNSNFGRGARA